MAHKITKITRIISVLFGFFVAQPVYALNCDLDGVGGSLPSLSDYNLLLDRIIDSDFAQCGNGACNFDGRGSGDPADVGDAAAMLSIVQTGSDPGNVCQQSGGGGNQMPTINAVACTQNPVNENARNCSATGASDPEGSTVSCDMQCYAGAEVVTNLVCSVGATCTYPGVGSYTTTMRPKDAQGLSGLSVSVAVVLTEFVNHAPTLTGAVCTATSGNAPLTTQCTGQNPDDIDGHGVTCTTNCGNGNVVQGIACTTSATCQFLDAGNYTITITPQDSQSLYGVSRTVQVAVDPANSPICGNGAVEAGEQCDDGNTATEACAYGLSSCQVCNSTCQNASGAVSVCGDSVVQTGNEQCDFGDVLNGDGCSSTCQNEIPSYVTPSFVLKFGSGILNNPRDLDINPATGEVFVADQNNNRVAVFNSTTGSLVTTIGPTISTGVTLSGPEAVCFSPVSSRWAIVDQDNARVLVMSSSTQLSHIVGSFGIGAGQFDDPWGCVFDANENLFVTDSTTQVSNTVNHRILKFSSAGVFLLEWGGKGTENGKFDRPNSITLDSSGYLYVADTLNYRVQKFTTNGVFVLKWGSIGSNPGQFSLPGYIETQGQKVLVVDFEHDRVQVYSQTGVYLGNIGERGIADGQFSSPLGIGKNASGNVFISDITRGDIQKFSP